MPLIPGTTLGSYRIAEKLGQGGMGEVFRAHDAALNRDVAIKVLPAALADNPERLARFKREAQVLASLNHSNIAHVYGFDTAVLPDGSSVHFLAMELVKGEDLAERLTRGAIPGDDAIAIAVQIAEGLEEAHEHGIIHRDLKPANIKVRDDGMVKVLDFGLAKAMDSGLGTLDPGPTMTSPAMTAAGTILGTAAYMAPEQARGRAVDKRADIWAFGAVFFEMLTGTQPFAGATVTDTLAAVLTRDIGLNALPPTTPVSIRQLLRRCLERNPKNRLHDIADARIVLDEALTGPTGDAPAGPQSPTPGARSPLRRALPWVAGLAIGVLFSGLAGLDLGLWTSPAAAKHFRAVTSLAGVQAQPALSPDGSSVAFVSNRDGHFNIYVGLVSGGNLIQITNGSEVKATPRWSPDGTVLGYARLNEWGLWDIWQVPALGGTPRRLILNAADPTWSTDGRSLAYVDRTTGAIWISDSAGQRPRQVTRLATDGYGRQDSEPRFSPDGRALAFVSRPGGPYSELQVLDLESGAVRQLTHDQALAQSPAWSPDGLHLYFASSRNGTMNIWKIAARGGEPEQITAGQTDDAQLDVSSDGRRIVFATFREKLSIGRMDLGPGTEARSPTRLITDPARYQLDAVYSPDGRHLAYFSNLKGVEREGIWTTGADGADVVPLVQDSRLNIFPRWSADGKYVFYMSTLVTQSASVGQYRRVSVSGGVPETILENVIDENFDVGAGGRLLFYGPQGKLQSHDPETHTTQPLTVSSLSQRGQLARWSSDSRSFAYIVGPGREGDSTAGLWVEDFGSPPRQLFRGWVKWYACGLKGEIVFQEGKSDLNGILWKVGWDGRGLERLAGLRLVYSYVNGPSGPRPPDFFDISPDGRHLAFNEQEVLQANIGMIETSSPGRR